jgi:hypothetical protein
MVVDVRYLVGSPITERSLGGHVVEART